MTKDATQTNSLREQRKRAGRASERQEKERMCRQRERERRPKWNSGLKFNAD